VGVTIKKAAKEIGVSITTLKRWMKAGKIPRPNTNRNGWYVFEREDISNAKKFANKIYVSGDKLQQEIFVD